MIDLDRGAERDCLDPPLVLYCAGGAGIGYLTIFEWARQLQPDRAVKPFHALIVLVSLGLMGIILSSLVQRVLVLLNDILKKERSV